MGHHSFDLPTTGCVVQPTLFVVSPADPWVERMEDEADPENRLILATRCLRHDPGCVEARMVLAEGSGTLERCLEHLRRAVEAGERLWVPVAELLGPEMTWRGLPGTRPYMRAIAALGNALLGADSEEEARRCYAQLLAMNPHDNQGIRHLLEDLDAGAMAPGP